MSEFGLNPLHASYLAGLLDGEAFIGMTRRHSGGKERWSVCVKVAMCDDAVLRWAHSVTGLGVVYVGAVKGKRKEYTVWTVQTKQAARMLRSLLPYLRVKKKQAKLVIEADRLTVMGPVPTNVEERERIYWTLRRMNARGAEVPAEKLEEIAA